MFSGSAVSLCFHEIFEFLKIMEDFEETLLTAPKYYWGCCQVCKRAGTKGEPLKRCSRCNCLFYCSKEHQKSDWKYHKKVCSYLSTAAEEVGAEIFFGQQIEFNDEDEPTEDDHEKILEERPNEKTRNWKSWTKFRVNAAKMAEILTGKDLEPHEKEIFLFPKACRVCRLAKKDGMIDCEDCMNVTYCSDQHKAEHLETHKKRFCHELKYAMVCDNYESTVSISSPAVPRQVDTKFNLARDMESHLKFSSNSKHGQNVDLAEMEFRFLSDRLSGPMTIVYCGATYGLKNDTKIQNVSELTIHLVGSNIVEMLGIIKWEYILHRLPKLNSLHLVFIGLELDGEEEDGVCPDLEPCSRCQDKGRAIKYDIRKMSYEKYCESLQYIMPDMACAFNCGFHEYTKEPSKDTWKPALSYLTRHAGVPLIFTSYNLSEAQADYQLILENSNSELISQACKVVNPYRSYRSIRDFEFDHDNDVFYCNQYLSVVNAKDS